MAKRGPLTKILGIVGTVLVALPVVAPFLFSLRFVGSGQFHFDYLRPAELFPMALAGGLVLLWAALRARSQRRLIGGGLAAAIVLLFGGQALAVFTGLNSGETSPESGWIAVVLASLALYAVALFAMGVGGVLLLRDAFRAKTAAT